MVRRKKKHKDSITHGYEDIADCQQRQRPSGQAQHYHDLTGENPREKLVFIMLTLRWTTQQMVDALGCSRSTVKRLKQIMSDEPPLN